MDDLPPAAGHVRIRQVALCTDDIWREERTIVSTLGVAGVFRDPPNEFEMRNTVFAVGDTFLEILQPTAPTAPSARFLDKHGGPGGYMLILQVDDLGAARARVDALGVRVVFGSGPVRHHGVTASTIHLHPADTGGTLISLDQMDPAEGWAWAGSAWQGHRHTDVVDGIAGVELASVEPDALVDRLGRLLGRPADDRRIVLDDGVVHVVPEEAGRRDQLTAVHLHATDRARAGEAHTIAGTSIRLV